MTKKANDNKIGYDKQNIYTGKSEYKEYNINQGVFQGHFYYGKSMEKEEQLLETVIFDDGSTVINWERFLVEQAIVDKKGNMKMKMLPYGSNQIKDIGLKYKHLIIPQKNEWSNKCIDAWIKRKCPKTIPVVDTTQNNDFSVGRKDLHYTKPENGDKNEDLQTFNDENVNKNNLSVDSVVSVYAGETSKHAQHLMAQNATLSTDNQLLYNNRLTLYIYYPTCIVPTLTTQQHQPLSYTTTLLHTLIFYLQKYMDVVDGRSLLLTASFILGSYCYSLFDSVGYIFFNSDKESGKTKFATLIGLMGFHTINCSSPSESALFRVTSLGMGLMIIDDFENISEEKKNALLQILKIGYRKDGRVIRVEKKKEMFVPALFDVYCPKIITNTTTLDAITLSRCIPIHLMKTLSNKGRLWPDEKLPIWAEIRDACHWFVMENWKEIAKTYEEYECEELNNRDLELVKGYLSIIKVIDSTMHDQLLTYIVECVKDRETVDMSGSWIYVLLDMLLAQTTEEGSWFKAKDVGEDLRARIVSDAHCEDEKAFKAKKGSKLPSVRWVGGTLSKIPSFKKRRIGAGVEYWLSKRLVGDYMKIKGFYLEPKKEEEVEVEEGQEKL